MMVLEDTYLAVDKTAESILKRRTLDSASSDKFFMYSNQESVGSILFIPAGKHQFNSNLSSFGHFSIIGCQTPSSSDFEQDRSLTKISMEMSEPAFEELWSKEDDSYWDSY